jgi:hypothetical protein
MTPEQFELAELIGLNLFFAAIFFFIGMAIKDVLNKGDVPFYGKAFVWLVLFLGCFGFVVKGLIQAYWQMNGLA